MKDFLIEFLSKDGKRQLRVFVSAINGEEAIRAARDIAVQNLTDLDLMRVQEMPSMHPIKP